MYVKIQTIIINPYIFSLLINNEHIEKAKTIITHNEKHSDCVKHCIQTESIDVSPLQKKERESERIWEKNMAEENDKLLCEYENMGKKEWENEKCEQVIKQNKTRKKTNKEQRKTCHLEL